MAEPTDEQLARFVIVFARMDPGVTAEQIRVEFANNPSVRAHWLEQHRRMQAATDEVEVLVGEGMGREQANAMTVDELVARHDARV